jgi:hypothetical protein
MMYRVSMMVMITSGMVEREDERMTVCVCV